MSEVTKSEIREFTDQARAWFKENIPPEPNFLLPETFMEVGTDQQFDYLRDWQRKVYEAGYIGISWPNEFGGGGASQIFQDIATREMSAQRAPFMPNTIGLNWAGPLILKMGSEADKRKYIKNILSAEDIWCQGFSEPEAGSDLGNTQCSARKDGDEYVVNGSKIWTSLGTYAKYMILLARTSRDASSKYAGLSFFLAPMKTDGIDPKPIQKLTGEYGFCQTFFEDARIPSDCLMGNEGDGWRTAMVTLTFERGASGGQAGGTSMMELNVNDVLELARRSKRNGQPAIEDAFVREQLVNFFIESKGNQLMNARVKEPALIGEWPSAVPLSGKLRNTELRRRLTKFSLALMGANGGRYVSPEAIDNGKWQRSYLNSFSATIGGGTSEIQHNILGERVLGLPKD